MSGEIGRQRAEAAFGHLQHAAREVIAAAHETLDLLDDLVSTTDFGALCDTVGALGALGRAALHRYRWQASPGSAGDGRQRPARDAEPGGAAAPEPRSPSGVQRITVR